MREPYNWFGKRKGIGQDSIAGDQCIYLARKDRWVVTFKSPTLQEWPKKNKLAKLKRHAIIGAGGLSASYYKKNQGVTFCDR